MNWAYAKNLCLIFLLLLNIFLFTMINVSTNKYKLNSEQKTAILNLLDKNNIQCDKIIEVFNPKKQISLLCTECDLDKIAKIFFENEKFTRNQNFIEGENKILLLTSNGFEYKNLLPSQKFCNQNEILSQCDFLIRKIKHPAANFILDTIKKNKDKLVIEYRQKYCDYVIFDNFIRFTSQNNSINEISYEYRQIGDFFWQSFEILPPDIILYDFIKNDAVIQNETNVINKFELMYKINDANLNIFIASPFYRIIYNNDCEMIFNAFSGNLIK